MSTTVADLVVKVGAQGVEATKAGLGQVAGVFGSLPGLAGLAGAGMAAGLVAGGIAATKMAGDFESGLTSLVTGAGESQNAIGQVRDGILKMAVDTGTPTAQLVAGMYQIDSAGYTAAKGGLTVLQNAAMGAKVGNADLGTVANATTTLMTDFGISAANSGNAVNGLIATVAHGKTNMQDLSASLSQVAPTASAAGISMTDMLGAMATMTGEGVPAANAATYLRQTIIALEAPSSAGAKALKGIGLSAQDVQDSIKSQGLPATLDMITQKVGKEFPIGSAAYLNAIKDISGGSKSMQGILDLTGSHMQTFNDNTNAIGGAAVASGNKIQGWANVQNDFNFKIDRAREVVETLMISIGTKLLPVVGQMVTWFSSNLPAAVQTATNVINNVAGAVQWVVTNFDNLKPILAGVGAVILTLMVPSFVAMVTGFGAWAVAAAAAALATIAATWPILAIGLVVGAVVAGIVLAVQHWGQITSWLGNLWGDVFNAVKATIQNAGSFIGGVANSIGGFFENLGGRINTFVGNIVLWFNQLPGQIEQAGIDMVQGFINGILSMAGSVASALGGVIHGAVSAIPGGAALAHLAGIPGFASGVSNFAGGLAMVGEQGPELAFLPSGTSVLPAGPTAAAMGGGGGRIGPVHIHVHVAGHHVGEALLPDIVRSLSIATGDRSH